MERKARALMARWGAVPEGRPVRSGNSLLWHALAGGQRVVFKMTDPDDDEVGQAAFLAAMAGRGTVRVLRQRGTAFLMERVVPVGASLVRMALAGREDAATRVLCDAVGHVAARRKQLMAATGLSDWRGRTKAIHATAARPEGSWLRRASDALREVESDRSGWRPIHADIHHGNVLHDRERGWLMIDPKGMIGPPEADIANILTNPFPHAAHVLRPARLLRQADVIAEHRGMTRDAVLRWTWLHASCASCWDDSGPYWRRVADAADRLRR